MGAAGPEAVIRRGMVGGWQERSRDGQTNAVKQHARDQRDAKALRRKRRRKRFRLLLVARPAAAHLRRVGGDPRRYVALN